MEFCKQIDVDETNEKQINGTFEEYAYTSANKDHCIPNVINKTAKGEVNRYYSNISDHSISSSYLKQLIKFTPLTRRKEWAICKRIKIVEEEIKSSINDLCSLIESSQASIASSKIINIHTNLYCDEQFASNDLLARLKKIDTLGKEYKRIESKLKKTSDRRKIHNWTQSLQKINTEVSKLLPQIRINEEAIKSIIKNIRLKTRKVKADSKSKKMIQKKQEKILIEIWLKSEKLKHIKNELITSYLRLVVSIAKRYRHSSLAFSDLIQEGNLGLMRAIDTFDYTRGNRLFAYATWWIKQTIIRAINNKGRTVRIPIHLIEKYNKFIFISQNLIKENKKPTLEEIANKMGESLNTLNTLIQIFKEPISMKNHFVEDDFQPEDVISDSSSLLRLDKVELSNTLRLIFSDLSPRERKIIRLRFGFGVKREHTLEEIGQKFNLSRERIRQIEKIALNKLSNPKRVRKIKDYAN